MCFDCVLDLFNIVFLSSVFRSKSKQKPNQNPSNILQKSIKNLPKISPGGFLDHLGSLLGGGVGDKTRGTRTFGGLLSRLGNLLGPSWRHSGPSWCFLGGSYGAKMATNIDSKIDHFFDASWNQSLGGFWWILGTKIEPSWHQNGINKSMITSIGDF